MSSLLRWLGDRTGLREPVRRFLFDPVPGGACWRNVGSSLLVFTFLVQVITGFILLTGYSAGTQSAWESVHHLQHATAWGWLLRGLHAIAAQAFVVLLALHLLQAIVERAYLAPRELNFLLLLILLILALKLSVTGWILPFDQKGFWAARVPLNLIGLVPVVGPWLQQIALGGAEVTHLTLTRLAAVHAVFLPAVTAVVLGLYFILTHRHRAAIPARHRSLDQPWWPHQALRDAVACAAVLAVVLFVVLRPGFGERGLDLMAPADPSESYPAARPEWFLLGLFQFLKFFPGRFEVIGAVILPGAALLIIAAMPWIGRWQLGRGFNTAFAAILFLGAVLLGLQAAWIDHRNPDHRRAIEQARAEARRAHQLAADPDGIPPAGALDLIRNDPFLQGPRLFARHCASCHRFDGHDGTGVLPAEDPTAADLAGFASRDWIAGLLDPERVATLHYFGGTAFRNGRMVRYVRGDLADLHEEDPEQVPKIVAALSAEAALPAQREQDARDQAVILEGRDLIRSDAFYCTDCHAFGEPDEDALGPDLTGYGSRDWLLEFLQNPAHPRFYGDRNDRMPAYGAEDLLDDRQLGLIADWLRRDWLE